MAVLMAAVTRSPPGIVRSQGQSVVLCLRSGQAHGEGAAGARRAVGLSLVPQAWPAACGC